MKKLFLVFIFILLISPVFAGGGRQAAAPITPSGPYQRDPNLNPPGTFPINRNTVHLKIGVGSNLMIQDWKTNWMTLQLERRGNYDLTFEIYPEFQQNVELMMMAGGLDLPDVLWGWFTDIGNLTRYGEAGMILPLNVYYENSAFHINQELPKFDIDIFKYITSHDGNIYGLPYIIGNIINEYNRNWVLIYQPWLDTLGLTMARTISEFENVLIAFKDRDPNGNGRQDEIPLIGASSTSMENMLRTLMNPFIYTQTNYWILNNGRIDVAFNKPAWRDGLRYVKSLLDQGLISPLSYTQNETQMTAMIMSEPTTVGAFARISTGNIPITDSKRIEYVIQGPLEGPGGVDAFWDPRLPSIGMLITKNCNNLEAAFMLGDLMCSEEMSVINRYGEKGVNWMDAPSGWISHYAEQGFSPTFAVIPDGNIWGTIQNKNYAQHPPYMISGTWANGNAIDPVTLTGPTVGSTLMPWVTVANKNPIIGLVFNEQEQQIMNTFHSTIINYVHESYARFIMGDLSIDLDWDRYVAEFNRMGLTDVIRVTQSTWDRMQGR